MDAAVIRDPSLPVYDGRTKIYESYFALVRPAQDRLLWLRYTISHWKHGAHGAVWMLDFSPKGVDAKRSPVPVEKIEVSNTHLFLKLGSSMLQKGLMRGILDDTSWRLSYEVPSADFRYLPFDFLYRIKEFPEMKLVSPSLITRFYGDLRQGSKNMVIDGAPGMIGHNWTWKGFPYQWVWVHALFGGEQGPVVLEAAASRIAPWSPFIGVGILALPERFWRFNSPGSIALNRFSLSSDELKIKLDTVGSPILKARIRPAGPKARLCYLDPDGKEGTLEFSGLATADVTLAHSDKGLPFIEAKGIAALEVMTRDRCKDFILTDKEG